VSSRGAVLFSRRRRESGGEELGHGRLLWCLDRMIDRGRDTARCADVTQALSYFSSKGRDNA
jgi:hypothetical protein